MVDVALTYNMIEPIVGLIQRTEYVKFKAASGANNSMEFG